MFDLELEATKACKASGGNGNFDRCLSEHRFSAEDGVHGLHGSSKLQQLFQLCMSNTPFTSQVWVMACERRQEAYLPHWYMLQNSLDIVDAALCVDQYVLSACVNCFAPVLRL